MTQRSVAKSQITFYPDSCIKIQLFQCSSLAGHNKNLKRSLVFTSTLKGSTLSQNFSGCALQPSSGVRQSRQPSGNFELNPLFNLWVQGVLFPLPLSRDIILLLFFFFFNFLLQYCSYYWSRFHRVCTTLVLSKFILQNL